MLKGWWNFTVVVLVVVVPCKSVFNLHSEFLKNAGNFISKARSHSDYCTQAFKRFCNFFNLRKINCSLLFDVSLGFCALTDCVTDSAEPGFKTGNTRVVQSAYIRNTVSFFKSVTKVGSQSTTDTNCSESLTQVAEFFNS